MGSSCLLFCSVPVTTSVPSSTHHVTTRTTISAQSQSRRSAPVKVPVPKKQSNIKPSIKHPPDGFYASNIPSSTLPATTRRRTRITTDKSLVETQNEKQRTRKPHRCSRCGEQGHNVRACPVRLNVQWYHQRCGRCGLQGHNARNCIGTASSTCRVCNGIGRLQCSKCNGKHSPVPSKLYAKRARALLNDEVNGLNGHGIPANNRNSPLLIGAVPLSAEQRKIAKALRKRHNSINIKHQSGEELIGGSYPSSSAASASIDHAVTAPAFTATSNVTPRSITGYIDNEVHTGSSQSASWLPSDDDDEICSRCMGSGHLTCMACN